MTQVARAEVQRDGLRIFFPGQPNGTTPLPMSMVYGAQTFEATDNVRVIRIETAMDHPIMVEMRAPDADSLADEINRAVRAR